MFIDSKTISVQLFVGNLTENQKRYAACPHLKIIVTVLQRQKVSVRSTISITFRIGRTARIFLVQPLIILVCFTKGPFAVSWQRQLGE